MTYGTIVSSVQIFQKLVQQPLPLRKAYQLSVMARKMDEELVFFRQKYGEITESSLTDEEKNEKVNELLNFEIEWTFEPLQLSANDDIKLSANDIDNTRGLIEITDL